MISFSPVFRNVSSTSFEEQKLKRFLNSVCLAALKTKTKKSENYFYEGNEIKENLISHLLLQS